MGVKKRVISVVIKSLLRLICKIDASELERIPAQGPYIIAINHINFLEVPLIQLLMYPRRMFGLAKRETWNSPVMRFLMDAFDAIPVDRGGVNIKSFRAVGEHLEQKHFVCIAPEGTRSGDGVLLKGRPGIVSMAMHTGAPILPVVHFGGENFWQNLKRFKRTRVTFRVGRPFHMKCDDKVDSRVRREMTDSVMYEMASLLPEHMRGVYSDVNSERKYLEYINKE